MIFKKNLNIKKEDDISNINLPNEFSNIDEILINKNVILYENKIKECFLVNNLFKIFYL